MNINVLSRSPAVQKRMAPPIHDMFRSRKCMISGNGSDIRPSIAVEQTVRESNCAGSGKGLSNDILGSYMPLGSVLDLSAEYMRRAGDDLFLSRVFRAGRKNTGATGKKQPPPETGNCFTCISTAKRV